MNWILNNKEWIFDGIGIAALGLIFSVLKTYRFNSNKNNPNISIHTQNINIHARDFHEEYDNALGIFIANGGNSNIHIQRALFRNIIPFIYFLKKVSKLPVYSRAFKDTERNAFELKFGDQWYDPQIDIKPRSRVMTYLPLSAPIPDNNCNKKKHGEVILKYSSDGNAGTHQVYV